MLYLYSGDTLFHQPPIHSCDGQMGGVNMHIICLSHHVLTYIAVSLFDHLTLLDHASFILVTDILVESTAQAFNTES